MAAFDDQRHSNIDRHRFVVVELNAVCACNCAARRHISRFAGDRRRRAAVIIRMVGAAMGDALVRPEVAADAAELGGEGGSQ